jgi:Na+-driven multidrug efflux pump
MRDQRKADADHLRLLSIFHFIGAGLAVLGLGFLALHYLFMHTFLDNPDMWKNQKGAVPPPKEFFAIFKWFYVIFGLWLVVSCILNVLSGLFIGRRKYRTFSLVVAFINCIHIPFGTVLGVFTIVVLLRPSVREVYEAQAPD